MMSSQVSFGPNVKEVSESELGKDCDLAVSMLQVDSASSAGIDSFSIESSFVDSFIKQI